MKKIFATAIAAAFALSATSAFAANAQQDKMKTCNKDATDKGLKGDDRKKFMADCLKSGAPAAAAPAAGPLAPKDAMKACMAAAKGKKGDEFKKFREDCLKAKGPANMK